MHASLGRARVALALAVALSACATRQSEHYEALRARLAPAPPPRSEDLDPLAGRAELTRAALVQFVLARNPDVETATAAARAALARFPQESALPDPMFGYAARPASFGSSEVHAANDFELSQALPFPGKLALRGERALAEADAAATNVEATRLRLAALASQLFDAYWLAERALETNAGAKGAPRRGARVGAGPLLGGNRIALRRARRRDRARDAAAPPDRARKRAHDPRRADRYAPAPPARASAARSAARARGRRLGPRARLGGADGARARDSARSCRRSPPRCARARPRSPWRAASSFRTSPARGLRGELAGGSPCSRWWGSS